MYALLALGFTLVYGIVELINFAHFNVFMVGALVAMLRLQAFGMVGQETVLTGPAAGRRAGRRPSLSPWACAAASAW